PGHGDAAGGNLVACPLPARREPSADELRVEPATRGYALFAPDVFLAPDFFADAFFAVAFLGAAFLAGAFASWLILASRRLMSSLVAIPSVETCDLISWRTSATSSSVLLRLRSTRLSNDFCAPSCSSSAALT